MGSNQRYLPEGAALTLSLKEGLWQIPVKLVEQQPNSEQCERPRRVDPAT